MRVSSLTWSRVQDSEFVIRGQRKPADLCGVSGRKYSFPNTRIAAEVDFYGGIRPTFWNLTTRGGQVLQYRLRTIEPNLKDVTVDSRC